MAGAEIIRVENLRKEFHLRKSIILPAQVLVAVDSVSFSVGPRQALGLVGESGCGKTTVGRCMLQLVRPTGGRVLFRGVDLTDLSSREVRSLRKDLQIVFQHPGESLNPRMKIGQALREPLDLHTTLSPSDKQDRMRQLMSLVGLKSSHLERYPHQFSGGQKQRITVARAIATDPDFIVLDEPTSALDVSVRGQILKLLMRLQDELDLSYLFITHDLSVVRNICQRVAVMYMGSLVETGTTETVFDHPQHPYTQALMSAVPIADPRVNWERIKLKGEIPSSTDLGPGCRLCGRCPRAVPRCEVERPKLLTVGSEHQVACFDATAEG